VIREMPAVPPAITAETEAFWLAGAQGELVVEQCDCCGLHVFPPRGVCRGCRGRELTLVAVRPPGLVSSHTVNHNAWSPDGPAHYIAVLVEFPEFSHVRFVGMYDGPETPSIGDRVGFTLVPTSGQRFQLAFSRWDAR
jgi:hypothetical protein